ncbi:NAD(P)H-hydrate dehydratase [Roseivirga sp. E12]|uniref:NAD(P)H-hydrate dehydratase n=1 Tax=Roseivirga sp. E12 TaxID=2819237 RepID=UPI001ABCCCDB|nr:NAD(P)H-hydrate dehydratase [Roseivirga sp. E12]MBO3700782.1 NAD(P)H-hydrate dehydratase [Roseivirga sp. E12]
MKKIIAADQIRAADQHTIINQPIASIDLMERAAKAFVKQFTSLVSRENSVHVVCGTGNNGGDGLAAARLLAEHGYTIQCSLVDIGGELSPDCQNNLTRLTNDPDRISNVEDLVIQEEVVIDALFGSGLNRPATGLFAQLIQKINTSSAKTVSIDIPSGLFSDCVELSGAIVEADLTIAFQRPKLSFLIPESGAYVGEFLIVDIGLSEDFIEAQPSDYFLLDKDDVSGILPVRKKFQHKGDFGRIQIFSGSFGKMGAAFLCGKAVLKSGAGLLTIHIPKCGYEIIQSGLPEAMVTVDDSDDQISTGEVFENTDVVCVGPGLGTDVTTTEWLKSLLRKSNKPMVIDADALNIIASHPELMDEIPAESVLTPHVGEFSRLFSKSLDGLERIEKMKSVASNRNWVIILKGAHTVIALPNGKVIFNTTGNSGMATAGSGDVLAGIITGLIGQGVSSDRAAQAGVYLHGMAGDLAKKRVGKMSLMASDLLNELPETIINVT